MDSNTHSSWRERGNPRSRKQLGRLGTRSLVVVGLLFLLGWWLLLLLPPFWGPRTHLVLVGGGLSNTLHVPTIPFASEDKRSLASLNTAEIWDLPEAWRSARSAKSLGESIAKTAAGSNDTLIVYLTAQGVATDDEAVLLCENFDLKRPSAGQISVPALLEQLQQSTAGTKVLLLNAGNVIHDPRLGLSINDFPALLADAVHDTQDPSLWVVCSHRELQASHTSYATRHSAFGLFVSEGLRGAADADGNGTIGLKELYAFTANNVSRWTEQVSGQAAQQQPALIWGGGMDAEALDPAVLSLDPEDPPHTLRMAELIEQETRATDGVQTPLTADHALGVLRRQHRELALVAPTDADDPASQDAQADAGRSEEEASQEEEDGASKQETPGTEKEQNKPDPLVRARQLLVQAWELRDALASPRPPASLVPSPIESAPHLWREFQAELLAYQGLLQAGSSADLEVVTATLEKTLAGQKPAKPGEMVQAPTRLPGADKRQNLPSPLPSEGPHSLALARDLADRNGVPLDLNIKALELAFQQDERSLLDAWLKAHWQPQLGDYLELRLLRRLADARDLPWPVLKAVVLNRMLAERIANLDRLLPGWMRAEIECADQLQQHAEQLTEDRVGPEWQQRTLAMLEQSQRSYNRARAIFNSVREAQQVRDTLLIAIPTYIDRMAREISSRGGPPLQATLTELLAELERLSRLLTSGNSQDVTDIARVTRDLRGLQTQLESRASERYVERLLEAATLPDASWQAHTLLASPFLSADAREAVSGDAYGMAIAAELAYRPAQLRPEQLGTIQGSAIARPAASEWESAFRVAKSDLQWVRLFQAATAESKTAAARAIHDRVQRVVEEFAQLESAQRAWNAQSRHAAEQAGDWRATGSLRSAYRQFGRSLEGFYQALLEVRVHDSHACLSSTAVASQALRMLDPRDAWRFHSIDIEQLESEAKSQSSWQWQASRLSQEAVTATEGDRQKLVAVVKAYRDAGAHCGSNAGSALQGQVSLRMPSVIDLDEAAREMILQIENRGTSDARLGLQFDYNPQLVTLRLVPGQDWGLEESAGLPLPVLRRELGSTIRAQLETVVVPGGAVRDMRVKVDRNGEATQSSRMIVNLVHGTRDEPCRVLDSQTVGIALPVGELVVQAGDDAFVTRRGTVRVLPYPNRTTRFRFGVLNRGAHDKQVALSLFALEQPLGAGDRAEMQRRVTGKTPLVQLAVNVPSGGQAAFPSNKKAQDKKEEPGKDAESDAQEQSAPAKDEPPSSAPKPVTKPLARIGYGLLAVLEDTQTGEQTFRQVQFAVQRPRRFIKPTVQFQANANRIVVSIAAANTVNFPRSGAVQLRCGLAGVRPGELKGKLEAELRSPGDTAQMFINMVSPPPQQVRLTIDVDGYPRSFVYDVPCGRQATIPEADSLLDVRVRSAAGSNVIAATDTVPMQVEVDAPIGSFEDGQDQVTLGFDFDGSGQPNAETAVQLFADRDVEMQLLKADLEGVFEVRARVSDFLLELPTQRLENVMIDLAGQIVAANRRRTLPSQAFLIDSAAPIIGKAELVGAPGYVPVGGQVLVSAWAWDEGSRVAQVEAAFAVDGSRDFPAKGSVKASQQSDREWRISLPAGESVGSQTLLVRAIDQVGNASPPTELPVEIISLEESDARIAQQTVALHGVVRFREDPVAKADVELLPAEEQQGEGPEPAPLLSSASQVGGKYILAGIHPGKYTLKVKGVVRNRVRIAEQPLEVAPNSKPQIQLDVDLP